MAEVGREMAKRLNTAKGPTAVLVPKNGWSIYGSKGGPLYDYQGNVGLLRNLKRFLNRDIQYKELDLHINDQSFADACVACLLHHLNGS